MQVEEPWAATQPLEKFFSKPDFWGASGPFPPGPIWTDPNRVLRTTSQSVGLAVSVVSAPGSLVSNESPDLSLKAPERQMTPSPTTPTRDPQELTPQTLPIHVPLLALATTLRPSARRRVQVQRSMGSRRPASTTSRRHLYHHLRHVPARLLGVGALLVAIGISSCRSEIPERQCSSSSSSRSFFQRFCSI